MPGVVAVVVVVLDAALLGAALNRVPPAAPPAIDAMTAAAASPFCLMVIAHLAACRFPPLGGSCREAADHR
jgi:hypothetical protein